MACEQAVRRGGLSEVTDSMWLVLAFQIWYVADSQYNEVRSIHPQCLNQLISTIARHPHDDGHHHRWFRFHAFCGRSHMGPFRLLSPGQIPSLQTSRTRPYTNRRYLLLQLIWILYLPRCKWREERFPQWQKPQEYAVSCYNPRTSIECLNLFFEDLQFFTTASGSKLLTSGWWGRSRHPNYL